MQVQKIQCLKEEKDAILQRNIQLQRDIVSILSLEWWFTVLITFRVLYFFVQDIKLDTSFSLYDIYPAFQVLQPSASVFFFFLKM